MIPDQQGKDVLLLVIYSVRLHWDVLLLMISMVGSLTTCKKGKSLRVHFLFKKKKERERRCRGSVTHHTPLPQLSSSFPRGFSSPILPSLNYGNHGVTKTLTFAFTPGFCGESHLLKGSTLYASDSQNQISRLISSPKIHFTFPYATSLHHLTGP